MPRRSSPPTDDAFAELSSDLRSALLDDVPVTEPDVVIGRTVLHVVDRLILPCHDEFLAGQVGEAFTDSCQG